MSRSLMTPSLPIVLAVLVLGMSSGDKCSPTRESTESNTTQSGPSCSSGYVPCGDICCPTDKTSHCELHRKCCSSEYPHHCAGSNTCYKYFTDAQEDCGTSYEICYGCRSAASMRAPTAKSSKSEPDALPMPTQ